MLERRVREALARQVDLTTAANAAVVISDDPLLVSSNRTLVLSDAAAGGNVLRLANVDMVAAAARFVAAGYTIASGGSGATLQLGRVHLTAREREVALLLLDGRSNKAIARALDISVHTAKFHVAALLTKLDARNRA
ncbi:MAG TPA: helix-turn-helix transcriptional regulator, partial [Candidatus Limnocylindria bacterium]|nr:helix-turn-helix transcriptional regulator [Candidatus Limnocylindria bacterium]